VAVRKLDGVAEDQRVFANPDDVLIGQLHLSLEGLPVQQATIDAADVSDKEGAIVPVDFRMIAGCGMVDDANILIATAPNCEDLRTQVHRLYQTTGRSTHFNSRGDITKFTRGARCKSFSGNIENDGVLFFVLVNIPESS